MSTNILDLDEMYIEEKNDYIEDDDLQESIFDFDIDEEIRIDCIERYLKIDPDNMKNIINRMKSMYMMSGASLLNDFLVNVCKKSTIDNHIKLECILSLLDINDSIGNYKCLDYLLTNLQNIYTICRRNAIMRLIQCKELKEEASMHVFKYLTDVSIEMNNRYEFILDIKKNIDGELDKLHTVRASYIFIHDKLIMIRYKILCIQNLLINYKVENQMYFESKLLQFAQDKELSHEIRSDAADVILNIGTDNNQQTARSIYNESVSYTHLTLPTKA